MRTESPRGKPEIPAKTPARVRQRRAIIRTAGTRATMIPRRANGVIAERRRDQAKRLGTPTSADSSPARKFARSAHFFQFHILHV
jgi:hypothetical protein